MLEIKENAYEDGEIEFKENTLTVEDFQELRTAVGWFKAHPLLAERSVNGTLYSACAYAEGKTVGMARVIGDGGMTLYVQDVIVHPSYQGQGIGKKLMEFVMNYIKSSAPEGSMLQVSLMASKGKESFYERFGFVTRPNEEQGAGMQQRYLLATVQKRKGYTCH